MSSQEDKMPNGMSAEDEKYYKKYLKYKNKYIQLEEDLEGAGFASSLKAAAKSAYKSPTLRQMASTAATVAAQDPTIQAKLAKAQQALANSPNAQVALALAKAHPTVQSAMANPKVQSVMGSSIVQTALQQQKPIENPDQVWSTLSLEKKQKLLAFLPTIN
jgi:hypothetical protein